LVAVPDENMLIKTPVYEVWCSRGSGMVMGPRFKLLDDAKRYIVEHRYGASMAIRGPDGRWEMIAARTRHYSSREIKARKAANTNR
jgi:hypothetical protein